MKGFKVKSVTENEGLSKVHCIETKDNTFVLDNGIVSHNSMGLFSSQVVSGGSGGLYGASNIITMTKRKVMDGKDKTGNIVSCRNYKGRLTREGAKAEVLIDFIGGLSRYHGMVEAAVGAGIWEKSGNRVVVNGSKLYPKAIYKGAEIYFIKEILDKIDEYVQHLYKYGSAIEEEILMSSDEDVENEDIPSTEET